MKVSVYVSAEQIQVLNHDGRSIKRCVVHPLPEGAMYNGTIIDDTLLQGTLASLKNDNPGIFKGDVTLIVDGSSILSRKIAAPKLSQKQYLGLIRDDFADSFDSPEEIVCGFRNHPTEENTILAFAVNKAQVDSYVSVFNEAGITLTAIRVGIEGALNFVENKPELKKDIIAFNIIDGMTMLTMIFADGANVFISRLRLYGDTREQLLDNALENLNGLMQFTQSQKLGQISRSYYVGVSAEEIRQMGQNNLHEAIQICGVPIYDGKGEPPPPEMHFCAFNMKLSDRTFDLISARKGLNKYVKDKKPKKTWLVFLILFALVLAIPAVVLFMQVRSIERDIREIEAFVNSPDVAQRIEEIDALRTDTATFHNILQEALRVAEWERALPIANGNLLDTIIFNHGIDIFVTEFNFNDTDGVVRLTATCTDSTAPNRYISALLAHDFIYAINYVGFTGTDGETFTFTIDIFLNEQEEVE